MKTKAVPSRWIYRRGLRLDAPPYLSGALEARLALENGRFPREPLKTLTVATAGGIYNGPQFRRNYVDSPEHGVPFVGSSSMLLADLSHLPYLRKQDALSSKLRHLRLQPGMTLISCSGTIGRMVYVRPDMDGIWSSQDIMKVVPDPEKIPPGYLYAFLSSRFGVPMVTSGTYGAIIQHIEPEHIANLPVPRLGAEIENKANQLIEKAASLREAANDLSLVAHRFDELLDGVLLNHHSPRIGFVSAENLFKRMDAEYHDPLVYKIQDRLKAKGHSTIGQWCSKVILPGIFKRLHTDDPDQGVPYFTGASLFWLEPKPKALLSFKTSLFKQVQIHEGTVLVQAFGQEGGLTGRPVWVGKHLSGCTTTHMLVRLQCAELRDTAYLFGFLQSDAAYLQIKCQTFGGSIPHFDENGISSVVIPTLGDEERIIISDSVLSSVRSRDQALTLEHEARGIVENAIEDAA